MIQEDLKKNLRYKPAAEDIAVYLKRPDHNFARGNIPPETVTSQVTTQCVACGDCHDAEKGHDFQPYKSRHFKATACQTCHIPAVHFWAYRSDDWGSSWTLAPAALLSAASTRVSSIPKSDVTGYLPAHIASPDKNNNPQIRPTNLITGVYWFDKAKSRPLFTWQMQSAFFAARDGEDWKYRPEIRRSPSPIRKASSISRRPSTTRLRRLLSSGPAAAIRRRRQSRTAD